MPRTFTDNQLRAIGTDGRDICVAAGAGSGKTGVLVERFIRLVTQSRDAALPPDQRAGVDEILVITFTEKATKEMKTRIVEELTRLGLTEERRQVETAYISTIHGFCSRLLQENPFEVGIDPHFTVMEEPQARRLLRQTVEEVIAQAYEAGDEEITELVATVQGLRRHGEEQADPVASLSESVESLLAKLRGAGRTCDEIKRHWKAGQQATAEQSEAMVWTVLNPVIEDVTACVRDLRALHANLLGTARGLCDHLLDCASRIRFGAPIPELLPALRELAQALRRLRTRTVGATAAEMEFAQYVGRLKASCESRTPLFEADPPDREQSALACHRMWGLTVATWRAYDAAKRRRGSVDNDDLQAECVRLLEDFPEVRERYQRLLRYLMVDEFQDTNPLQMRLIRLLHVTRHGRAEPYEAAHDTATRAGEAGTYKGAQGSATPGSGARTHEGAEIAATARGRGGVPPNYLFVVGDVQQSIYGFRGAEPSLFRGIERSYREEAAGVHVPLSVNFRSRPEILQLIALLFRRVWSSAETPFVPLEAGLAFDPVEEPCVELLVSQDLMRLDYMGLEPAALARRVRQLVEGQELRLTSHTDARRGEPVRYRDIAILLRQLTDIQRYEEAFARAGVPYFVVGGGRGYYARQEIRDLLNILTVLDTPLNDVALMAALRSPMVGAELDTLYWIVALANHDNPTFAGLNAAAGLAIAGAEASVSARETPAQATDGRAREGAAEAKGRPAPDTAAEANGGQADAAQANGGLANGGQTARPKRGRPKVLPLYIAMKRLLECRILDDTESAKLSLFLDVMDSLREQEDRMPVGRLLERLISRTSYDARLLCRPNGRRRLANVRKLLQMANSDPALSVREFIRRLRDMERLSDREGDAPTEEEASDVVRFHTIHGAKGLEFPVVILADLCRTLEHSERGLFVCEPHSLALGARVHGGKDAAYRAVDHQRLAADREEAERLLYVAMTRARERLILCGNLGRNRGLNWGDHLFPALGINEAPHQPETQTMIGGVVARVSSLSHYLNAEDTETVDSGASQSAQSFTQYVDRLVEALLNDLPLDSVAG